MVYLPSEGVTVPDQKKNKIQFTESRGQKKVHFAGNKPRATGQIQVQCAWKGSGKLVRGFRGSGSTGVPVKASARVTRHSNKWESVRTEDESGAVLAVTDVGAWEASTGLQIN
ncbi:hypothetical protein HAX54_051228 [Datura stramonium]|uniref:Uncharacterized protein n=1 Tax=Datura stramonium TaxID=4076 RepID=A0ABS8SXZ9_DATST|nr:hypothetical protein [Datura stramonium]